MSNKLFNKKKVANNIGDCSKIVVHLIVIRNQICKELLIKSTCIHNNKPKVELQEKYPGQLPYNKINSPLLKINKIWVWF